MKKIRILIITVIIIITIIISIMLILLKSSNKEISTEGSDTSNTEFENKDIYKTDKIIKQVDNKNKYYAVDKIINTYIRYIKEMKGIIDFQKYDEDEVKNEGIKQLYNILDSKYISDMNINKDNLQNKIKEYDDYVVKINKMYSYELKSSINIYFVYISIDGEDVNLLIKTDSENMTFSIFLQDYIDKYSYSTEMNIENIKISDDQIQKNDDNQYKYSNITDEYMAIQYMNSLKNNLISDPEYTYNSLLEEDYKLKRFGNYENFKKYIEDNKEEINNINISKYMVNNYEKYTEYVCMDQYENYYIFKQNAIMDYTVKFDNYVIATQKFEDTYKNSSEEEKVQMNVNKFIQMINRHDYLNSYECISENFKNNYFKNQEDFKNYIENNFFYHNKLEYTSLDKKGNNLYVCGVKLTDLTGENPEAREITIIMKLNEDMDFEMSFGM